MEEEIEIILRAIDDASGVFDSVGQSAQDIGNTLQTAFEEATAEVDRLTEELAQIELGELDGEFDEVAQELAEAEAEAEQLGNALETLESQGLYDAGAAADGLGTSASGADEAVEDLGNDLSIIEASNLLQAAEQLGMLGQQAEMTAQQMNEAVVTMEQLSIQTGVTEPELTNMINTITNAAFPQEDAMLYIKSLDQMGVSASNFAQSATDIDAINDAFGLGAQTTNSMAVELGVLGVDLNNVSESFNALAYANANTAGGMQNFYTFLRKYDSQFHELGLNVDQAAVLIAGATQKFGGGRAALTGLNDALKESNGDLGVLEQKLGLASGSLTNASQLTGEYAGQLQQMADAEEEHTTILQQLGDMWDDFSLSVGNALSPLLGVVGAIGQFGQFGLQVGGLKELGSALQGTIGWFREFNLIQSITNAIEGEGAIARIASAVGITTEAAAAEGATVAFGGLAIAEGAALWPILAIIAAIVLLVAAVYEIGKAFGWWHDVGSMFDAIRAGIMRMWDAFINHPDVQAAISMISSALSTLWSWIQQAGQAILEFFGVSTGGEWDIVRSLIDGIGLAWQLLSAPIRVVISVIQMAIGAFSSFYTGTLVPLGEFIMGILNPVFAALGAIWSGVMEQISGVVGVFQQFQAGQVDLVTVITTVATSLWNIWLLIVANLSTLVLTLASNLLTWAIQAGLNFLTGIVLYLSQVPGRVWNYLVQTTTRILTAGARWVSTARTKASQVVSGIISFLSSLPGRVASAIAGVVTAIISAGVQWVSSAREKAQSTVDGARDALSGMAGAISGALSGVVDAIVQPFRDAYDTAKGIWDQIANLASNVPHVGGQGGDDGWSVYGDSDVMASGGEIINETVSKGTDSMNVDINHKITLDLENVPSHIDTPTLINALQDKKVLKALTGNPDFQSLDAKVKEKINLQVNRARGV